MGDVVEIVEKSRKQYSGSDNIYEKEGRGFGEPRKIPPKKQIKLPEIK